MFYIYFEILNVLSEIPDLRHCYQVVDGSNNLRAPQDLGTFTEDNNCYDVQLGKNNDWGNYFYFGGPGRNPNCP